MNGFSLFWLLKTKGKIKRSIDRSNDLLIERLPDRSNGREDLIICVAIWTLYKQFLLLVSGDFRMIPIASRNKLRFTSFLGPIFKDFGSPNGPQIQFSRLFFSMLFFNAFEHPSLVDFWRLRIRKIAIFARENNDFCKIGVFDKSTKVARFCLRFWRPKPRKSIQKSNPKTSCF